MKWFRRFFYAALVVVLPIHGGQANEMLVFPNPTKHESALVPPIKKVSESYLAEHEYPFFKINLISDGILFHGAKVPKEVLVMNVGGPLFDHNLLGVFVGTFVCWGARKGSIERYVNDYFVNYGWCATVVYDGDDRYCGMEPFIVSPPIPSRYGHAFHVQYGQFDIDGRLGAEASRPGGSLSLVNLQAHQAALFGGGFPGIIERLPERFELSLASIPKPFGYLPQGKGEYGNGNRPQERKKAVVNVDHVKAANGLHADEASDDEAVLVGTFGGLLAGWLGYTLSKRMGDKFFGRPKDNEKARKRDGNRQFPDRLRRRS